MKLGRTRRVHFVGIGGSGMSGIAELLANLGYRVSGSDTRRSDTTERLEGLGVEIHEGHAAANIAGADVLVVSSAIQRDNPEVAAARKQHVPVIARADMLAELMRLGFGIAVAGAHGKTTTTSMIALVLERGGLDPTAVIGGRLSAFGSNARLGKGECIVVEADESDKSFLRLSPQVAVITNLDREHMENYGSFEAIEQAFVDFANKTPFYGAVIACADDALLAAVLPRVTSRVLTYGFASEGADVRGSEPVLSGFGGRCRVRYALHGAAGARGDGDIALSVPGYHNLMNALAAVTVGLELGVPFAQIASALADFKGAERRFQVLGEAGGVTVIDDYGHHPTEITAVIDAARASNPQRIVVAFQPHRFSRTRDLLAEFGPALGRADQIVLTEIYAAGEAPIEGVSGAALLAEVERHAPGRVALEPTLAGLESRLAKIAQAGDLVITLGAGSICESGPRLLEALRRRPSTRAQGALSDVEGRGGAS
ncbi:MAG TPA: UDP-N-acetylmuramate--L-alanine ligase [Vicinamibacterales bacterium]|nr:UDP-N-acetylmuramate--L-alanine ligase [Vicinamibacterales bacterium]